MSAADEARFKAQALAFLRRGASHEETADAERGKQRVITLVLAYGEFQKAALAATNMDDYATVEAAKDSSLRVLRAIEPLLAKRKRKKPRGRSIIE